MKTVRCLSSRKFNQATNFKEVDLHKDEIREKTLEKNPGWADMSSIPDTCMDVLLNRNRFPFSLSASSNRMQSRLFDRRTLCYHPPVQISPR